MKTRIFGALALAALLPLAACDDDAAVGPEGPGVLSLLLTDAPGDFEQAWVQIERVEMTVDDDDDGEAGESEGDGDGEDGRVVLRDDLYETDLLTLSNDVATLVDEASIPAGTYGQLRFVIPAACIIVAAENEGDVRIFSTNGYDRCATEAAAADPALNVVETGRLQTPSFAASGLKVNLPDAFVLGDNQKVLLLDFDVSESFGREAGNSGMWVMRPVIKAADVSLSSSITVTLVEAENSGLADVGSLADFEARLESEEEPVAFTDEDEDGTWTATFFHLLPSAFQVEGEDGEFVTVGDYTVSVGLQDEVDPAYDFVLDPESPVTVELGDGVEEVVDFTLTSASEATGGSGG